MKDSDYLFPSCAVTLGQVKAFKDTGVTRDQAAKMLGVNRSTFTQRISKLKLGGIFHSRMSIGYFMPGPRVTLEAAMACEGMTIDRASTECGVSRAGFRAAAVKHDIINLFNIAERKPDKDRDSATVHPVSSITGINLVKVTVDCYTPRCTGSVDVMVWPGEKPDKRRYCSVCKRRAPTFYEEDAYLPRC